MVELISNSPHESFYYFDPQGLFRQIANASTIKEDDLELGKFQDRKPWNNFLSPRTTSLRQQAYIIQSASGGIFAGVAGIPGERELGYIEMQKGEVNTLELEGLWFEQLTLRLNRPIPLTNRLEIPCCRVRIYAEGDWGKPEVTRSDRVKYLGPFWKKVDLSKVIPTEWILSQDYQQE